MRRRDILAGLAGVAAGPNAAAAEGRRLEVFATASGLPALDGVEGPGNPFATAFIEALGSSAASAQAFFERVSRRTLALSAGAQSPQWSPQAEGPFLRPQGARRALLLIFSNYPETSGAPALPGAAFDAERLAPALEAAGFQVETALDPTRAATLERISKFGSSSRSADVALLYCTGHGVEVGGRQYVLPLEFELERGEAALPSALAWEQIAAAPAARRLSVAIWAGCRDNPLAWRVLAAR